MNFVYFASRTTMEKIQAPLPSQTNITKQYFKSLPKEQRLIHEIGLQKIHLLEEVQTARKLLTQEHRFCIGLKGSILLSVIMPFFSIGFFICTLKRKSIQKKLNQLSSSIAKREVTLTKLIHKATKIAKKSKDQIGSGERAELFQQTNMLAEISEELSHFKTSTINKAVAKANKNNTYLSQARHCISLDGVAGTWIPYGFRTIIDDGQIEVLKSTLNPTSDRDLASSKKDLHIFSLFVLKPKNKTIDPREYVITMSVPYTKRQGEELKALISKLHEKSTPPFRTAFHSLLTKLPSGFPIGQEEQYIMAENHNITALEEPNSDTAHTNNALNAISDLFPSTQLNSNAYKKYVQWALESFPDAISYQNEDNESENTPLLPDRPDFQKISEGFLHAKPESKETKRGYRTFQLLYQLHTNTTLSPTSRVLIELALDRELGVTSVINCKSGEDRTGHIRSLDSGITQLLASGELSLEERPEEYISFLTNLSENVRSLNNMVDHADHPLRIDEIADPMLQKAFRLQNLYFEEMQRVALPITALSSGVQGLKYSLKEAKSALFANPHILPFVPRFAFDGKNLPVELIKRKNDNRRKLISKDQQRQDSLRLLTKKGLHIIQGLAKSRGT